MGRHSSPEQVPFLRSVGAWALPWLLLLAVVAIALVVVFDMVGNDPIRTGAEDDRAPIAQGTDSVDPEGTETTDPERTEPAAPAAGSDDSTGTEGAAGDRAETQAKPKLITDGVDVQVLNGTSESGVDDLMADKLARLGYSVVAVSPAGTAYDRTVVFWTEGSRDVGEPLAARFDWKLEPAPSNLSQEVHLHIMVGADRI